ncbi:MAG TPA: hypothetical protein VMG36_00195 [Thermoplasmata archaeon]|nr:hypothetical protein [Thermoplasmata archaeon]
MAGDQLLPLSPSAWDSLLRRRLEASGVAGARLRVIRSDGTRAIVEVEHRCAARARSAWNGDDPTAARRLTSVRTWGTLRGAKAWLRAPTGTARPTAPG